MGNAETLHGRLTPAVVVAVLLALAAVVTLVLAAGRRTGHLVVDHVRDLPQLLVRRRLPQQDDSLGPELRHLPLDRLLDARHGRLRHVPPLPRCATAILADDATHTGCGTYAGCHGGRLPRLHGAADAEASVATTLTAKVTPTTVKVGQEGQGLRHRRPGPRPRRRQDRLQGRAQGRHEVGQDEDPPRRPSRRRARTRGATRPSRRARTGSRSRSRRRDLHRQEARQDVQGEVKTPSRPSRPDDEDAEGGRSGRTARPRSLRDAAPRAGRATAPPRPAPHAGR